MESANDTHASRREERWFLFRLLLITVLIIAGSTLLIVLRQQWARRSDVFLTLPNGTVLTLRAISVGTSHSAQIPYAMERRLLGRADKYVDNLTTQAPRLVLWLGNEDSSGQPLEMKWFRRATIVVSDSESVPARNYHLIRRDRRGGSSSSTDDGGFSDAEALGSSNPCSLSLVRLELPLIRPTGPSLALRVEDGTDTILGTLEVPAHTLTFPAPTWVPDTLPATRSDGNLEVTLNSVTAARLDRGAWQIKPELSLRHDGEPSDSWISRFQLSDELGNTSAAWSCNLSRREPAWKLNVTLEQRPDGKLRPEDHRRLPARAVSPPGQLTRLSETYRVNGIDVSLIGWGGTGPQEFQLPQSTARITTGEYRPGQGSSGMSTSCRGNTCDIELISGHPFLATSIVMTDDTSIQIVFRGSEGNILPHRGMSSQGPIQFWFFEPEQVTSPVEIEIIVQKFRHAEFLISPPEPTTPGPGT